MSYRSILAIAAALFARPPVERGHRHLVEEQSEAAFALGLLGIDAKESGA